MAERTDEKLMRDVSLGETGAMELLVQRYKDRLLHFLIRITGDTALAEDLFQETFLRVYKSRDQYQFPLKFAAWLFTIARRLALNELEKRSVRRTVSLQEPQIGKEGEDGLTLEETLASEQEDPLMVLQADEQRELLEEVLGGLPEEQRTLLYLYANEDLSYRELAAVAGCSPGAMKVRFFRAFKALEVVLRRRLKERS